MQEQNNAVLMTKVAIYARVSTEEQAEHGYSIDAQLDTLRQYCKLYHKEVVGEYVDRGVSGKEMTRRHELQKLLRDAEKGIFNEVIVWKFNRMSRKTKDLLEIVELLDKHNVHFRSFSESFDTSTPMGKFALQMMGAVGELERNTIVENVKLGMKQRARMGFHNGGACLGYECVEPVDPARKGKKKTLEILPEEAAIVKKIFTMYAAGRGFRSIANKLNREGHKTKKGNTFASDSIREIIINPVYVGIVRYNRFEGWSEKRRRGKNPDPILAEGKHEGIIEQGLWDKVQMLFQQKSKASPRLYDGVSLLTGLIRCPECGSPMVASRTVNYLKDGTKVTRRYYSCGQFRSKGSSVCHANSIQADAAETYVLDRIKKVLKHPKLLTDIVKAVNEKRVNNQDSIKQELPAVVAQIGQVASKKRKILDVYELDGMDRDTLGRRLEELTQEEETLLLRKFDIETEISDNLCQQIPEETIHKLLLRFDQLLGQSPPEQKKTLLHLAIQKITLTEDKKIDQIILNFDTDIGKHYIKQDPSAENKADGLFFAYGRSLRLAI